MGRGMRHRVGDKDRKPFQLSFNGFVKVDFQGSRVTSDGGLLLVRELDERLGLGKLIDEQVWNAGGQARKDRYDQSLRERLPIRFDFLVYRRPQGKGSQAHLRRGV